MGNWETWINIAILVGFLLFNCLFWIDEWSEYENDSQGLFEWCSDAEDKECCQSVTDSEIYKQDWFQHFKKSISGAWFFIALTVFVAPYSVVLEWEERKMSVLVVLLVACFSSAACLMVSVIVYGNNFKRSISLEKHTLHASFELAIVCLLLYTAVGIATIVFIIRETRLFKRFYATNNREDNFTRRWSSMHRNCQIERLDTSTNEFDIVRRSFMKENESVCKIVIYRIQNRRLYNAHLAYEESFMSPARHGTPYAYRKYLWHGTASESKDNISQYGFNRNFRGKNACSFGEGVYFATKPSYSSQDGYSAPDIAANGAKYVYKCSVFVGTYTKGEPGMKEPPKDDKGVRYNSTVNDPSNPNQHIIFYDNQAYPQYLIKFEKKRY